MTQARRHFSFLIQGRVFSIPEHMREGLIAYVEQGRPPGDFLYHTLANNLIRAAAYADELNISQLPAYANYMESCMPFEAQGSYAKVDAWIARFAIRQQEQALKEDNYENP